VYPRALADLKGLLTYEQVTGSDVIDIQQARNFTGNGYLGFKVGLCERDVAIYGSVLLFAILFEISGKKIKQLPWYWWVILAIVPIGLDGFSQLPSLVINPPAWMPIRESTPLIRTITGFAFGFFSAWFVFPLMEQSVAETRVALQRKLAIVQGMDAKLSGRQDFLMIERSSNGLRYFEFETFQDQNVSVRFYSRQGGVSPAPWNSLNQGGTVGDSRDNVVENRKRIFGDLNRPVESIYDVWQVHGNQIIYSNLPRDLNFGHQKADAIFTENPDVTLFMRFADCVPIVLYAPN